MKKDNKRDKQVWDPALARFMDHILEKVKVKQAAEVGTRAVEYFRGSDFKKFTHQNSEFLNKKFSNLLDGNLLPDSCDAIAERLVKEKFIYRAHYKPFVPTTEQGEDVKIPKWPKRLEKSQKQTFDDTAFYVVLYEGSKTWRYVVLGLLITIVLLLCMFPAWPLKLKVACWYVSVVISSTLIFFTVLRLITFVLVWFFGFDFWIMPNLFDEEAGLKDSILPLHSFVYRNDTWTLVGARIFCGLLSVVATYQLNQVHSVHDVGEFAKQSFIDVLDWGHLKLAGVPEKPRYPSINDIEATTGDVDDAPILEPTEPPYVEEEEDYTCLATCGYSSYEELLEDCLFDCDCMKLVVTSSCFSKCTHMTQMSLNEAKRDACFSQNKEEL